MFTVKVLVEANLRVIIGFYLGVIVLLVLIGHEQEAQMLIKILSDIIGALCAMVSGAKRKER